MDGRGDHGEPVAIIGVACRFPGARDPAEFHELAVTGRRMFQPVRALPGRPLRAATLDDWAAPQVTEGNWLSGDSARVQPGLEQPGLEQAGLQQPGLEQAGLEPAGLGQLAPADRGQGDLGHGDLGPVQKLATEMTALALTDAGLREAAGHSRTGMIIASTVPGLGDLVSSQLGFAATGPYSPAARTSSLRAVTAAAAALQAAHAADLIVIAGPDAGLAGRAAECGGVPAVAITASRGVLAWPGVSAGGGRGPRSGPPGPGPGRPGPGQVALAEAIAALFVAGAVTDLRPYLGQERATASGDALASRTAPRMRPAEPPARTALAAPAIPAGPPAAAADGMGTRSTAHSAG